jgi:hypothetical protein
MILAGVVMGATPAAAADPVIMAAGDIACPSAGSASEGLCSDLYTSNLARAQKNSASGLAALLAVGDTQYEDSTLDNYASGFNRSWGAADLRGLLRPVPGNHEYQIAGASGYFQYFPSIGVNVGASGKGWYSYNIGSWHIVALNSSDGCLVVSCAAGSEQETWLKADLAASSRSCTLVHWHHPLSDAPAEVPIWQDFYAAGVDFVITGHFHGYVPPRGLDPSGLPDADGPREVVVGTGGKDGGVYGLLKMTLHANSADWSFVGTTSDSGSATCRRATVAPPPPPPPPPPPSSPPPASAFNAAVSVPVAPIAVRLTPAQARAAMRREVAKRLRHWKITGITCTSTNNAQQARCIFGARRPGQTARGSGTVTALSAASASFRVKVRISGQRPRTWTGRTKV